MAGVRIRWRGVARVAAIIALGLIAVRLLPGLLRAPEPPPLAADVGLPKAAPATGPVRGGPPKPATGPPGRGAPDRSASRPRRRPRHAHTVKVRPRRAKDAPAAKAVIGSKRRRRVEKTAPPRPRLKRVAERVSEPEHTAPGQLPPPPQDYVPPPAPEPAGEPLPEPAPASAPPPGDGSEEFAPH